MQIARETGALGELRLALSQRIYAYGAIGLAALRGRPRADAARTPKGINW
jgi:hypothetical protein